MALVVSVAQIGVAGHDVAVSRRGDLVRFRAVFYACVTAWSDELVKLTEALLCTEGLVRTLVELTLAPERRRGHGALLTGSTTVGSRWRGCGGSWPGCRCPGVGCQSPAMLADLRF